MSALQLELTSNSSNATVGGQLYAQLTGASGSPSLLYTLPPSGTGAQPLTNGWAIKNFQVFLFAFELLSTIGYGEIAPKTSGGRLWLCLYSLVRAERSTPPPPPPPATYPPGPFSLPSRWRVSA
jgi:hypothetical protein